MSLVFRGKGLGFRAFEGSLRLRLKHSRGEAAG